MGRSGTTARTSSPPAPRSAAGTLERDTAELVAELRAADSHYSWPEIGARHVQTLTAALDRLPAETAWTTMRSFLLALDEEAAAAASARDAREQELAAANPDAVHSWAPGGLFSSDPELKELGAAAGTLEAAGKYVREAARRQADRLGAARAADAICALWREETRIRQRRQFACWAEAHQMTLPEYEQACAAHLQQLVDKARLALRIPEMAFASVLKQGRFKTQHEIERSRGYKDAGMREQVEHALFGTPLNRRRPFSAGDRVIVDEDHRRFADMEATVVSVDGRSVVIDLGETYRAPSRIVRRDRNPAIQTVQADDLEHADLLDVPRPVYGYLTDPEFDYDNAEDCVKQYGAVRVIVSDARRPTTTVTFADSLDSSGAGRYAEHHLAPAPAAQIDGYTCRRDPLEIADVYQGNPYGQFTEAQFHGGLTVGDIAEVHFTRRLPTNAVAKALERHGIPWRAPSGLLYDPQTMKLAGGVIVPLADDPYADVPLPAADERIKAAAKTANYLRNPAKIEGTTSTRDPSKTMYLGDKLLYERARELETEHPLTVPAELDVFTLETLPPSAQLRQLEAARARGLRVSRRLIDGTRRWAEGTSGRPLPIPGEVFVYDRRAELEPEWDNATPPQRIALLNREDALRRAADKAAEIAGVRSFSSRRSWHEIQHGAWTSRWVGQLQEDAARWQGAPPPEIPGADGEPTEEMVREALVELREKTRRDLRRHQAEAGRSKLHQERAEEARGVIARAEAALAGASDGRDGLRELRRQALRELGDARAALGRKQQAAQRRYAASRFERARAQLAKLNRELGLDERSEDLAAA